MTANVMDTLTETSNDGITAIGGCSNSPKQQQSVVITNML